MSTFNPFDILQDEFEHLKSNLQLDGTKLIDHLFAKKVLTQEQMEGIKVCLGNSKKIDKLVSLLTRRPAGDFDHFMEGLEEDQTHIKDYLQTCIMKKEKDVSEKEMADDQKYVDEDHGNNSEDESTDSDSDSEEGRGQPVKLIKDFVRDPQEQDVTLHVKVMKVGGVEKKSNKKQIMATVADATSAVDICVREEKLFDKFKLNECIILRNVTWTGKTLFVKFSSTATFAAEILVPENIVADAFGEGDPVLISKVPEMPELSKMSLRGKIVKQSPLTKRKCYGKVLLYCQVKLMDDTGFVYMDVWGDIADQIQMGRVFKINSCKKRESERSLDSWITTTPRSTVTLLPSSDLNQIQKGRYQRGKLMGIDVTPYMSCPTRRCFRFQLTDGLCESCQRLIPDRDQVSYGVAIIDIRTQKGNIHQLTVYWPELCKLFGLFKKNIPPGSDKEEIVKSFRDLMNKTMGYQACGIVRKFKR